MGRCGFCNKKSATIVLCESCGRSMCIPHIIPEAHECAGLEQLKDMMRKEHEKALLDSCKILDKKQVFNLATD